MIAVTETVYRLAPAAFEWRSWDGEAVIYDAFSGDTHRVARPAGHILRALEHEPAGLDPAGLQRRAGGNDPGTDPASGAALEALLDLGIVEEATVADR